MGRFMALPPLYRPARTPAGLLAGYARALPGHAGRVAACRRIRPD